jgi:hypothetical protein
MNLTPRHLTVGIAWMLATGLCVAAGVSPLLVTPQEMQQSNEADSGLRSRAVTVKDAPAIDLIAPKLPGDVPSPTPIEVQFTSNPPSKVKPETFRALYGTFQIDITSRILGAAQVSASGIKVEEARLPKGKHRLQLMLEDTEGRVASRWVEFEVK